MRIHIIATACILAGISQAPAFATTMPAQTSPHGVTGSDAQASAAQGPATMVVADRAPSREGKPDRRGGREGRPAEGGGTTSPRS
ncbi:hypothetical protein [Prosthecomicrobium sp. N25]|uniref:hypothetical protein n=1 Tax=Prosthecomicrobium sp. N25 TaxID=3129254 RepID=UPI003076A64B